ncbi:hypothetical protein [Roseiconus lacunae]|uniref:hypothetical protein n=1 Tax=Roseiconus lacunae TaxID=2605694 RepID=UPI0011F30862|nr:hypothetical protein [Roseiconus lacunae]
MNRLTAVPNLLSLDAVTVGLVWMSIFSIQFLNRWPHGYEYISIGGAIWIIYTADRILDGLAVTDDATATERHRFHRQHRRRMTLLWCVAVTTVAWVAATAATERQLRGGILMIAFAICYLVSAQWLNRARTLIPKEFRAGILFAFGVTLTCWTSTESPPQGSLAICTFLAAGLFTINCLLVSTLEIKIDSVQGSDSLARRIPLRTASQTFWIVAHAITTTGALVTGHAPTAIAFSILLSDACLFAYARKVLRPDPTCGRFVQHAGGVRSHAALKASLADASLIVAPLLWITVS